MSQITGGDIIESVRRSNVPLQPESQVILVDPSNTSFTLQDAIDQTVAGKGDVIVTLPGGITVTTTVLFNKSGIRVMSLSKGTRNPLVNGEYHAILADGAFTDGPVAKISAPCVIDGIGFASRDTGATFFSGAACLIGGDATAGPFGVQMINCRFPKWGLDNRIGLAIEGSSDVLIEECIFEGVGSNFQAGIYIQGAMQNIIIRNNYFRQCTAALKAGTFTGSPDGPHLFLHGNHVEDGKLFDTDGNAGLGLISDNWLETATDTASYDRSVATLKGVGWNFSGNHYSE